MAIQCTLVPASYFELSFEARSVPDLKSFKTGNQIDFQRVVQGGQDMPGGSKEGRPFVCSISSWSSLHEFENVGNISAPHEL